VTLRCRLIDDPATPWVYTGSVGRLAAVVFVIGLAGCDRLFAIEHVKPTDADVGPTGDVATPGDLDGDGSPDAEDNCPAVSNPDQHDHDGDGKGDTCDPCPHLQLALADMDADGDGLGNGCDPYVNMPGDTRALFVGFYSPGDISGWTQSSGNVWTVADGVARLSVEIDKAALEMPMSFDDISVEVGVKGTSISSVGAHQFSISAARARGSAYDCSLSAPTDGNPREIRFEYPLAQYSTAWTGQLTQKNAMTFLLDGTTVHCRVGGLAAENLDLGLPIAAHTGWLGFVAHQVGVEIDFVFVAVPGP
jgi:hypothetical protein